MGEVLWSIKNSQHQEDYGEMKTVSVPEQRGAFLLVVHACIFARTSLGVKRQAFTLVEPRTCSKERSE